ncbi:FtsW/RodA/SpoVE family cell cycle protein [Paenibacillus sp. EC2-1]|uniref:FtsW/RodA/SpoVE family cell cycle protein n=1 Tax=Paenibacillus sp. EC2-1 TaxID=3388665 RepID=UPI003BEF24C0
MLQRIQKMDFMIVAVLIMLMLISVSSIYSVTIGTDLEGHHMKMLIYYIVGFLAFFCMSLLDFRLLIKYARYIYLAGLALLVFVMFFGADINGSKGWIKFGTSLSLQPAEMFKLVLIIFLTYILIRKNKPQLSFIRDVIPVGLLAFLPFVLVMGINDLGNALSYVVILVGLLWIGNLKFLHALIGLVLVAAVVLGGSQAYIHYHDQIKEYLGNGSRAHWMSRLDPWLVPDKATTDAIYHTKNAKLAIASGGLSGEGFMQGTSVQSDRVPYTYSDSIFAQIAEEFGFVGSSILLLLYFVLIHRMILIALECRDRAGPLLIVGMVAMFLYQIFENIGMFIGLMPLTGITLPFISFGGTSLVINMASLGVVMSVKFYGQEIDDDLLEPNSFKVVAKVNQARNISDYH